MINLKASESNETWIRYLQEKYSHEEALRKSNREKVTRAYEEEKARVEQELEFNKAIYGFKQKKVKEFWDNTRQTLGPEILFEKSDLSEEKVKILYNDIQARQYALIAESCALDSKIKDSAELVQGETYERPEISEFSEEAKNDYIAKTAHTVQMIDFLKYKRSLEGPKVIQKSAVNQTALQTPVDNSANALKYISRRDKVARLIVNSPVFPQPLIFGTQLEQATVKSPVQQNFIIPEEQPHEYRQEQHFVARFDAGSNIEESPQQFSVKMEKLSPKDRLREQFSVSKSHHLAYHSNIHNDPHFEEKNFVKKNLDLYRRNPEHFSPNKMAIYDTAEEMPSQLGPPNAFDLSKEAFEGAGDLDESFIARLNEKFRNAYLEANGKKPLKKNKRRQPSASGASPVQEIAFVQDDTIRESQLISSLMSPHASDLAHINQRTGFFSGSKEIRGREGGLADQYDSSSPQKSSSKKQLESRRVNKKVSPSKKGILMNELFDQFESEFILTRDQQLEEAEREQKEQDQKIDEEEEFQQSEMEKISARKKVSEQKPPIINVAETEDFILELTRLVTQGNGLIPSKCQTKLTELVTSSQVAKQDKAVKSKVAESLGQNGSSKKPKAKLLHKNQGNPEIVNRQSVDEFNAISVHLDNLSGDLTAKYLEYLKARVSIDPVRVGWTALLALFAGHDKTIPITNGKLNVSDENLTNYLGQPGRVKIQLQRLTSLIIQNPISQSLLSEFYISFESFSESISRGGSFGDLIHFFKYLYFVRRFIDVARASDLIRIKTEQRNEPITRKKNEEYLLNAQKRKEEGEGSVHRQHVREEEEAYGINFVEWEHNLDEIERENKMIQSNLHTEKVKNEHEEKRLRIIEEKKQVALELEIDRKQIEKAQQLEKENKEREKKFLHEQNFRNAQYKKALREQQNEQRKQYEKEIIEQTLIQSEFRAQKIAEHKEQVKKEYQERSERIKEKKETKATHQRVEKQIHKEERVWEKAQRLLLRQRKLLQEREQINRFTKVSYR